MIDIYPDYLTGEGVLGAAGTVATHTTRMRREGGKLLLQLAPQVVVAGCKRCADFGNEQINLETAAYTLQVFYRDRVRVGVHIVLHHQHRALQGGTYRGVGCCGLCLLVNTR